MDVLNEREVGRLKISLLFFQLFNCFISFNTHIHTTYLYSPPGVDNSAFITSRKK